MGAVFKYTFFILVNVKTSEFEIFYTNMKDWRLRLSAMKSAFRRWAEQDIDSNVIPYQNYFRFFQSGYDYAYKLASMCMTKNEAIDYTKHLTERISDKLSITVGNVIARQKRSEICASR